MQGTRSHAEAHTTLHTNTHNSMHRLMHTSPCSCDCTGVTPARTYMSIQTQHLHPARARLRSAPHTQPAPHGAHSTQAEPEQPHVQPGVSRAPAGTHAAHTLRLSPTPDAVCAAARSDKTVVSRLDTATRLAAGTDTFPIPPKSPSVPPAHLHLTP